MFGDLIAETTAEVILGEFCGLQFRREFDKATGYSELVISKREEMKQKSRNKCYRVQIYHV